MQEIKIPFKRSLKMTLLLEFLKAMLMVLIIALSAVAFEQSICSDYYDSEAN